MMSLSDAEDLRQHLLELKQLTLECGESADRSVMTGMLAGVDLVIGLRSEHVRLTVDYLDELCERLKK